ncbi:chitin disaccharide deacetylase [Lentibacillus sp. CBA3610]|uniref:chitin disaccharide deacetylase n=1 Tax=Lentibacillus sp. CBA3610 TaxID=2518176 RepID=UPI001595B99F|nr:chitin disaccharide deacetylase [Lentibacillus sp. CBA3610]QKY70345.1 chitin disaccharide deacetylase [Lentibacillus sp. CBA3610]
MLKLIINADDFGYSRAVNYGIIDAHTEGVLTSTTCLTNMPGAEHAYQLGREHTRLGIGVHLTLTCGRPLLDNHQTLIDADGNFKKLHHYEDKFHIDQDELYREWKAQIEAFLDSGLTPTHLDSHHHINNRASILPVFIRLAKEYELPVRNNFDQNTVGAKLVTTDKFEYNPEIMLADTETISGHFQGVETVEIMCHPAYLDKFLMENSSYAMPRLEELASITHPETKAKLGDQGHFELITFNDLRRGE